MATSYTCPHGKTHLYECQDCQQAEVQDNTIDRQKFTKEDMIRFAKFSHSQISMNIAESFDEWLEERNKKNVS